MRTLSRSSIFSAVSAVLLSASFASSAIAAVKVQASAPPSSVVRGAPVDGTITAANVGGAPIAGNTDGGTNNIPLIDCTEFGTVAGPERIYAFTPGSGASLTFTVNGAAGSFDPAIYVLTAIGDTNSCLIGSDDEPSVYSPSVTVSGLTAGATYYLYVDSYWSSSTDPAETSGPFSISVTGTFPVSLKEYKID